MVAAQAIDRRPGPPAFAVGRFAYRLVVALVFAFMLMPVVFVAWVSFFANEIVTFPPQGYTLSWYTRAWANRAFTDGFLTSIQVGLFSMVAGLILGIPASFAIVRGRFPGREALNALMLSPLVVPGVVAGTAIYIYFVQLEIWTEVRFVATLPGLVAAHVMLTIPWTVRLISASLVGVDRSIEEAAMNLGATPAHHLPADHAADDPPRRRGGGDLQLHRLVHGSGDDPVPHRARALHPADRAAAISRMEVRSLRRGRVLRAGHDHRDRASGHRPLRQALEGGVMPFVPAEFPKVV
jgi:hypothetical protein